MPNKKYKYKFSFILPIYNVETYLAEAIDSVLNQTIGFKENCELILVNDGSTDNSEKICLQYAKEFPENVTYIKQKNLGPGAARNAGLAIIKGEYVCMPDADDKLSIDVAEETYKFFRKHYDEIDVIGLKWKFFEAKTGDDHPLNHRFVSDRVIDLSVDPSLFQASVAAAVFKSGTIKKYKFDPTIGNWAEDLRFMAEFLLDNLKYGVVTKPCYYYRKRHAKTSNQDLNRADKFWYLETPKRVFLDLFDYVKQKNKSTIPIFIQYMAAYDLQFRFKTQAKSPLNEREHEQYKGILSAILAEVDDHIVMEQVEVNVEYKLFMLTVKYGKNIFDIAHRESSRYVLNGTLLYDAGEQLPILHPQLVSIGRDYVQIEGYCTRFLFKGTKLQIQVDDLLHDVEFINQPHIAVESLGEIIYKRNAFKVKLPVKPGSRIRAYFVSESYKQRVKISPNSMSKFSNRGFSYRCESGLIVKLLGDIFYVQEYSKKNRLKAELRRINELMRQRDYTSLGYRIAYRVAKIFYRRPIWIVTDRIFAADDNGEVFFRYLTKNASKSINVYFAISKDSPERSGIKKYGKILNYYSFRHKLLFLLSDKMISSQAGGYAHNLFGTNLRGVMDLYNFDYVFLQHGIIRDDISGWLNRYKKDIKLFVTSAEPEYKSIIEGDYAYDDAVVKLTGLPRYDNLVNNPKNKLVLAPTWRKGIANEVDQITGVRAKNEQFKETDYYKFYQSIVDDKRLQQALKKYGITGEMYLHPAFEKEINDFTGNEIFKIVQFPYDYPKMKKEGNLLVTDYSSVAFDFAYLKKPVIYAQFDADSFYDGHVSDAGYLSYEKDGLGEVTYSKEQTVDAIIKIIQDGCKMLGKYQKRVDNFFAYTDRNNCERIYHEILKLDKDS